MDFPKNIKDVMYALLQEPTIENFRKFMETQTGEHNSIDFKEKWIEKDKLAKELLSIANSSGGVIIFGVKENADKSLESIGLDDLKDKANVSKDIRGYMSSNLKYEIYDFVYDTTEYQQLINKKFQMLVIEDTPEYIPFICKKDGSSIKSGMIYIRRGTSCEFVNEEELCRILERRNRYIYPVNGEPLKLKEHLSQLKVLYDEIPKNNKIIIQSSFSESISAISEKISSALGSKTKIVENPNYPEEDYEVYVSRLIGEKKKKIERVLDLK